MLSKKEFAESEIHKFAESAGLKVSDLTQDDIIGNTHLAVAMEYLGQIEADELKEYATRADWSFYNTYNPENKTQKHITARDLLKLLPNEVRECRTCYNEFYLFQFDVDYYEKNGYQLPLRCKSCRDKIKVEKVKSRKSKKKG